MYYDKQKVIDYALSQVGYHEKATNSQLDDFTANSGDQNWNKYAAHLDTLSGFYNSQHKNGYAWCDIFVDFCFAHVYGRAAAQFLLCQPDNSAGAGCSFSAQYFRNKGQFHEKNPQPGDQIFFGSGWGNVWHTGLVVSVGNNHVYTVEGNTTDSVGRRRYALNDSSIWGYGRPDWGTPDSGSGNGKDNDVPTTETPLKPAQEPQENVYTYNVKLPLLMIGDRNGYVKAAQTLLIALGYDCGNKPLIGTEKADGDFGRATERAVAFFQSKNKDPNTGLQLESDGEIGGATWAALLKF